MESIFKCKACGNFENYEKRQEVNVVIWSPAGQSIMEDQEKGLICEHCRNRIFLKIEPNQEFPSGQVL